MNEYQKYLATEVLSSAKPVTYRVLSRALKVHVNTAKQMLFEFHRLQNQKSPNSVYATYLVYGDKNVASPASDGDVEMSSTPDADTSWRTTLALVEENGLEGALQEYNSVYSIHVYSLSPHAGQDLQLLSESNNDGLSGYSAGLGSMDVQNHFGGVANSGVRLRDRRGYKPPVTDVSAAKGSPFQKKSTSKLSSNSQEKTESPKPAVSSARQISSTAKLPTKGGSKGPSSSIMQSFAKASAKASKSLSAAESTPAASPDVDSQQAPVYDDDDDGGDDDNDSGFLPRPKATSDGAENRKSRVQREAELRRMMDEDDGVSEISADVNIEQPENPSDNSQAETTGDGGGEARPDDTGIKAGPIATESGNVEGRRRGKRRVMKKKQIQDEEGYLITVQEPVWESFSEDETPQPRKTTPASAPAKAKKPAPKGQGSIMSFFAKKS